MYNVLLRFENEKGNLIRINLNTFNYTINYLFLSLTKFSHERKTVQYNRDIL